MACANWRATQPSNEIRRVCQEYLDSGIVDKGKRIPLSYPLEHALKLLIGLCQIEGSAAVLDQFMREELARDTSQMQSEPVTID